MNPAVIIPWRDGEDDLQATIDSAADSIGAGEVYPVEDKTGAGPGQTRHRGIIKAKKSDIIILVDAHMRFDGDVLRRMARQVARRGGLLCAKCYHNEACSFDSTHPSGATYYAGANIEYMGEDQNGHASLVWKWSSDQEPGERACVGGACYVFKRSWYMKTGQCLSALPGWGGDEEALSITAWLSGHAPRVFDGRVAHRWRARAPWKLTEAEHIAIRYVSRAAIIGAVVSDPADAKELLKWQGAQPYTSPEVERWRKALLKQPRSWKDWKREVAGIEDPKILNSMIDQHVKNVSGSGIKPRANYGAYENKRTCSKCGSAASVCDQQRDTGRLIVRYRTCKKCGEKRTTQEIIPQKSTTS